MTYKFRCKAVSPYSKVTEMPTSRSGSLAPAAQCVKTFRIEEEVQTIGNLETNYGVGTMPNCSHFDKVLQLVQWTKQSRKKSGYLFRGPYSHFIPDGETSGYRRLSGGVPIAEES